MKKQLPIAVSISNVFKTYTIHHERPTLVEQFVHGKTHQFTALNNINLTVKKGERVGIIGPNGSGKTTLLKIIAGIATPTRGTVDVQGRLVSLIDLEAGFHSDLTGEQNIYVNGLLLGMKRTEIQQKLKKIIAYAGLGPFIDAPLFMYSSGMKLKLGFSVAIHSNAQTYILDEGLGVGDKFFREKARKTLMDLFKKNKTIIISAHNADIITQLCNRVILITRGSIIHDGNLDVLKRYERYNY